MKARQPTSRNGRRVTKRRADGPCRLEISEPMTIYQAAALKARLVEALDFGSALELDMTAVTQIDTAGIQLVLLAKRECDARGKTLELRCSSAVSDLASFYNLAPHLGLGTDIAAAQPAADKA